MISQNRTLPVSVTRSALFRMRSLYFAHGHLDFLPFSAFQGQFCGLNSALSGVAGCFAV